MGLTVLLAVPAAAVAGPGSDAEVVRKGNVRIVVVDEDGNRHEESFEFDGDHPRPFLGVVVERADEGVRIRDVIADSGAETAGLAADDVIVSFNGQSLDGPGDLTRRILHSESGDRVDLEILRDGSRQTVTAEIGERDDWVGAFGHGFDFGELHEHLRENLEGLDLDIDLGPRLHALARAHRPKLGVQLVQPTPELREHLGAGGEAGVLVGKVIPGTPAEDSDIRVGDLIVSADGEPVESPSDLIHALHDKHDDVIELEIIRDGRRRSISAFIPEPEEVEGDDGPRA